MKYKVCKTKRTSKRTTFDEYAQLLARLVKPKGACSYLNVLRRFDAFRIRGVGVHVDREGRHYGLDHFAPIVH